jgi:hypothetical protein
MLQYAAHTCFRLLQTKPIKVDSHAKSVVMAAARSVSLIHIPADSVPSPLPQKLEMASAPSFHKTALYIVTLTSA